MSKEKKPAGQLLALFEELDTRRQDSLLDFARYLHSQGNLVSREIGKPEAIPRPQQETVVGAIKRLKATYYMVENMTVFSDASALMTEHMINGRDSVAVIDDMEKLFEEAYQALLQEQA